MTEQASNGNGSGNGQMAANGTGDDGAVPAFALHQIYVKDISFEAPSTPQVFLKQSLEPDTQLNIRNSHVAIEDNHYEVVLNITVHSKQDDNTLFLVEIQQAGVFVIENFSEEQTATLLGTQCPATLFPYARETIATMIGKGGFPPLVLQPINFETLYAQSQAQGQQGAQA